MLFIMNLPLSVKEMRNVYNTIRRVHEPEDISEDILLFDALNCHNNDCSRHTADYSVK